MVFHTAAAEARVGAPTILGARTSKLLLAGHGIPVTGSFLATTAAESVRAAARIGYPVALKIESPDVSHKTDVGGVRLALTTPEEVEQAFFEVVQSVQSRAPNAQIVGVCIEKFATGGVEVIVGISRDPVFGPVIIFGLGGVFVEILDDVSARVAPLRPRDIREMISEVKGWKVLQGFRSSKRADVDALVRLISDVAEIAEKEDSIFELDLNPIIVRPDGQGAVVVDARIVTW